MKSNDAEGNEPMEVMNEIPPQKTKTVKDFDPDDQPREKAEKHGCQVLGIPDLWAIILRTGTPGNPVTKLCRDLMNDNGGRLHNLERRTRAEIRKVKGIGLTKSIQIEAVMELMRRYAAEEPLAEQPIKSSESIYQRMRFRIGNLDHEEIWMLVLNRRNQVTREIRLTSGSSVATVFDLKNAVKHALLENAESVILCHNHPSGATTPSPQDDNITKKLAEACRFMDIKMLDHVIVTATGFYSYCDNGKL